MENNLTETLTSFISQITQMEMDNKKLNEDIRELEKEKVEGYKTFNTETHVLVEREVLQSAINIADELSCDADSVLDNIESAESCINDARYNAEDMENQARDVRRDLEKLLVEEEKEEKPTLKKPAVKKPAVKITVNRGDYNA